MKIFYSWQTDTDERTCKTLIHTALNESAADIGEELDVDHDTKRVLGSRNIVDVIAEKIEAASVFVADVTLIGVTEKPGGETKKQINSNVAIELGYAQGAHTDREARRDGAEILVKVMNVYYGDPPELPFDARDRHPILFSLAPDATKSEWKQARDDLKEKLIPILRGYYEHWQSNPSRQPPSIERTPSTIHPGAYWDTGQYLVDDRNGHRASDPLQLTFDDDQPLLFLRVAPMVQLERLGNSLLSDIQGVLPLGSLGGGFLRTRNKFGEIIYFPSHGRELHGVTQLFSSREIWGSVTLPYRSNKPEDLIDPEYRVYHVWLRKCCSSAIAQYASVATEIGYQQAYVEVGLVNIAGRCWLGLSEDDWPVDPRILYEDIIVSHEFDIAIESEQCAFVKKFIHRVLDDAGVKR